MLCTLKQYIMVHKYESARVSTCAAIFLMGIHRYTFGMLQNMLGPASGHHGEREIVFISHGSI